MLRSDRARGWLLLASLLAACSGGQPGGPTSDSSRAPALGMMQAGASGQAAPVMPARPQGPPPSGTAGSPVMVPPSAGTSGSAGVDAGGAGAAGMAAPLPQAGAPAPAGASQVCAAMVAAAKEMIASLEGDALKSSVVFPFERRRNFAYEPQVPERPGASLMMMNEAQQQKALALVRSGLSEEGFKIAENVRMTENLKAVTGFQVNMRDPSFYFLAIFGEPGEKGSWAWQFEGHHLALHYTVTDCAIADAPTFVGAWPAEVSTMAAGAPPVGTRYLQKQEELGRALVTALNSDPMKRMQVIVSSAYRQTTPEGPDTAEPATPSGLVASAMSASEQMQLRELVEVYASMMAPELAAARMKRIEDLGGWQNVSFVWSGALEPKQRHYYRIQGKSFSIEYRNDDGNHIHTAWRDFTGEFGGK